jgi:hypothetical protein
MTGDDLCADELRSCPTRRFMRVKVSRFRGRDVITDGIEKAASARYGIDGACVRALADRLPLPR